jgi:hypothetical protein
MIKSTCEQLVGQRLKGTAIRWSEASVLAITVLAITVLAITVLAITVLAITVLRATGSWNPFRNSHCIKTLLTTNPRA